MKLIKLIYVLTLVSALGPAGCGIISGLTQDRDLKQGVAYIRYLSSDKFLSQSAFSHTVPDQTPSQFVSYLFSTMGSAEWVVTGDPFEAEQLKSIGVPVPPSNVIITNRLIPDAEKQLVLKGDDQNKQIIVEAYLSGSEAPVFTEEISFEP